MDIWPLMSWWNSFKQYLRTYNTFPSDGRNGTCNDHQLRTQILSTRIYIISLVIILLALTSTKVLMFSTTELVTLERPSLEQFNALNNPSCICSNVAIPYSIFMSVEPEFHSICRSDFISDRWIYFISRKDKSILYRIFDFRTTASSQFQALASICNISLTIVEQSLLQFGFNQLISIQVIPPSILQIKLETIFNEFKLNIFSVFSTYRNLVLQFIVNNQLFSGLETNFVPFYINQDGFDDVYATMGRNSYEPTSDSPYCFSCDSTCQVPLGIYDSVNASIFVNDYFYPTPGDLYEQMSIPGLVATCYPVQSMLLSTLECFYDQFCINNLTSFISLFNDSNQSRPDFTALDDTTDFMRNRTIENLFDNMMIETWSTINMSYENYYRTCAPSVCTYSITKRNGFLEALTLVIGIYGGLIVALRLLIPWIVKKFRNRRQIRSMYSVQTAENQVTTRLYTTITKIKRYLLTLNIFRKGYHDPTDIQLAKDQVLSTRLFFVTLIITLFTLILYSSIVLKTQQETIYQPTEIQVNNLHQLYPFSLSCTCTSTSVLYDTFISIEIYYHQLCSSLFISQQWMDLLNNPLLDESFGYDWFDGDLRLTGVNFFQILQALCRFSQQTINSSQENFLRTQIVNNKLIEQSLFESQIQLAVINWKNTTVDSFVDQYQLIRAVLHGNQLLAGYFLNFVLNIDSDGTIFPLSWPIYNEVNTSLFNTAAIRQPNKQFYNHEKCICAINKTCRWYTYIANIDINLDVQDFYSIPGLFSGCFPINSAFESTLECFYSQACMNRILYYYTPSINESQFPILNLTLNNMNETIGSIVNRMMIDHWKTYVNFSAYFAACAPSICTYETNKRQSFVYIILTIIGVFGGLTTGLRILIPLLVRIYRKITRAENRTSTISLVQRIKKFVLSLNLFYKINSNEIEIQTQRQITRFYLIVYTTILITVYLYSTLSERRIVKTVLSPSLSTYQQLQTIPDLQCSCSRLSIPYSSFFSFVRPTLHEVCSSDFITQNWISFMFTPNIDQYLSDSIVYNKTPYFRLPRYSSADFRSAATFQFQLLADFCQLMNSTISNSIQQLETQYFINNFLLSETNFNNQINSLFDQLKQTIATSFTTDLRLIRSYIHTNTLVSMTSSNWQFVPGDMVEGSMFFLEPVVYDSPTGQCSCGFIPTCVRSAQIGDNFTLPGFLVGCLPLESLLQSTLEFLYNQTLVDFIVNDSNIIFNALMSSSRFQPNATTIEYILSELMVEHWESPVDLLSYQKYYEQCAPLSCVYAYMSQQNMLVTLTSFIAFAGGLSVGLKILMPCLITIIRMIKQKRRERRTSVTL